MFRKGEKIYAILGEKVSLCTFVEIAKDNNLYNVLEIDGQEFYKKHFYCFKTKIEALDYLINKLSNSIKRAEIEKNKIINKFKESENKEKTFLKI